MISRARLRLGAQEWGVGDVVAENDYVLGWLLWGIGSDPTLREQWVFKGGTCLKKCYLSDHRFSQDLDFTVRKGGPVAPEAVLPILRPLLQRVSDASGLDFAVAEPRLDLHRGRNFARGRIYYTGPRRARMPTRLILDLSGEELLVLKPEWRAVLHDYGDKLPPPATVLCYPLVEVFAEKIRAMGERGRPRDLYDLVSVFLRPEVRPDPAEVRPVLARKCAHKGIPVPNLDSVRAAETLGELKSEWRHMLDRQMAVVPSLDDTWGELPAFFRWLEPEKC